eukprot:scaffold324339_cov14-Prasinocladus_malaysianus.AAC.1
MLVQHSRSYCQILRCWESWEVVANTTLYRSIPRGYVWSKSGSAVTVWSGTSVGLRGKSVRDAYEAFLLAHNVLQSGR